MMCFLLFLVYATLADCFLFDHRGEEFILAFPEADVNTAAITLTFKGAPNTVVEVKYNNLMTLYTIGNTGTLNVVLNSTVRYTENGVVSHKGVEVEAEFPASLHVISDGPGSTTGYMALPTDKLSKNYLLVSSDLPGIVLNHRWTVVAMDDNTNVIINIKGGTSAGCDTSMTFTLNEGDVVGGTCGHDFTGSGITSDKPIAVFYSTVCSSTDTCRHIEEMLPPVMYYGNNYVLNGSSVDGQGMIYRVVGSEDNTLLIFSSGNETMIGRGGFAMFNTPKRGQMCLKADKPILVTAIGRETDTTLTTIMMTVIQPVERFLYKYNIDIDTSISTPLNFYVTLTFHKNHSTLLPPEFAGGTAETKCCLYRTATVPLSKRDFSIQFGFPFGAVLHGLGNDNEITLPLGYQYGAQECPSTMEYSSETRMCIKHHLLPGRLIWTDTLEYCGDLGQQLPKLDTAAKNVYARDVLENIFNSFYIGANDIDGDDVLTWQDGDVVTFTDWESTYNPDANLVNGCVALSRSSDHLWSLLPCSSQRRVLCQLELVNEVDANDFVNNCSTTESETTYTFSSVFESTSLLQSSVSSSDVSHLESGVTNTIGTQTVSGVTPSVLTTSTTTEDNGVFLQSKTETILQASSSHVDLGSLHTGYMSQGVHITGSEPSKVTMETYTNTLSSVSGNILSTVNFQNSILEQSSNEYSPSNLDVTLSPTSASSKRSAEETGNQDASVSPSLVSYSNTPIHDKTCTCDCLSPQGQLDLTNAELAAIVKSIKHRLRLEKNNLTNHIGRRISRFDRRLSAARIGYIGITCLVLTVFFIVFLDLTSFVRGMFTANPAARSGTVFSVGR